MIDKMIDSDQHVIIINKIYLVSDAGLTKVSDPEPTNRIELFKFRIATTTMDTRLVFLST